MLFLMEPRLKEEEVVRIMERYHFTKSVSVDCKGSGKERSGDIILMWNDYLNIDISSFFLNHLKGTTWQEEEEDQAWSLVCIYGY